MDLETVNHLEILQKTGWDYYEGSDKWFLVTCPYCGDTEESSKKKKCHIFKDTGNFKCYRCGEESGTVRISNEFLGHKVSPGGIAIDRGAKMAVKKVKIIPKETWQGWHNNLLNNRDAVDYLSSRGLSMETITEHKIGAQQVGDNTYVVFPYFVGGRCTGAKKRNINSKSKNDRFTSEPGCTATLYNVTNIKPGKPVIVTESEIDCLSLLEVGFENVVSCPGCSSWKDNYAEDLSLNPKWYLMFDPDDAGQSSAGKLVDQYGNKCRNIIVDPTSDINDLHIAKRLTQGMVLDAINKQKAKTLKSSNAFRHDGTDIMEVFKNIGVAAKSEPTGFKSIDEVLGGWRPHEITIVSAESGEGKSTVAFLMALEQAKLGRPSCMVSLEEPTESMIIKQLTHFFGKPYHECTEEEKELLKDKAMAAASVPLSHHHNPGFVDVDELISDFIYEVEVNGAMVFVVDHLDFIESKMAGARFGDLKYTSDIMKKLSNFVKNYPAHIILIAHTRKRKTNQDGMEVKRYTMNDIRGNSDIIKLANNVVFFYRINKLGNVELEFVKVRSPAGKLGVCDMHFSLERMKLQDLHHVQAQSSSN